MATILVALISSPFLRDPAAGKHSRALEYLSSLNDIDQHHHDRDHEENVDEPSHRVRGDQTHRPEDKQNNGYGPEHFSIPPLVILRRSFTAVTQTISRSGRFSPT